MTSYMTPEDREGMTSQRVENLRNAVDRVEHEINRLQAENEKLLANQDKIRTPERWSMIKDLQPFLEAAYGARSGDLDQHIELAHGGIVAEKNRRALKQHELMHNALQWRRYNEIKDELRAKQLALDVAHKRLSIQAEVISQLRNDAEDNRAKLNRLAHGVRNRIESHDYAVALALAEAIVEITTADD